MGGGSSMKVSREREERRERTEQREEDVGVYAGVL